MPHRVFFYSFQNRISTSRQYSYSLITQRPTFTPHAYLQLTDFSISRDISYTHDVAYSSKRVFEYGDSFRCLCATTSLRSQYYILRSKPRKITYAFTRWSNSHSTPDYMPAARGLHRSCTATLWSPWTVLVNWTRTMQNSSTQCIHKTYIRNLDIHTLMFQCSSVRII